MTLRGMTEIAIFGIVALALQAAVFLVRLPEGGAEAAGLQGDTLNSLEAASAAVQQMVARFDAPLTDTPPLPEPLAPLHIAPPSPPQVPLAVLPPLPELPAIAAPERPRAEVPPDSEAEAKADPVPDTRPTPKPEARKKQARPAKEPAATGPRQAKSGQDQDQAAQRAKGTGGNRQAGQSAQAQSATASPARARSLIAEWGGTIRARIERAKRPPSGAGRGRGVTTVRLTVTRAGQLASASVARSSGNPALDQAALSAVRRAGRFPPAPAGLSDPTYRFAVEIQFAR